MDSETKIEYISKDDVFDIVMSMYCASSDETEEVLGNIIEAIRKHPPADVAEKPKWHALVRELPEEPGTYLICTNRRKVVSGSYAPMFKRFNGYAGKSATHWMNTPEPPDQTEYGTETD